ncbi:Histone-lysine N-methyltransferase ATXR2 [Sesamum angolense]|uniref:Histone-lysine N-methyltransferase ATXR2 n=1 Tax=Sesamum angolense TaxID=2727404 RepID=A0AAE1WR78_9LAMI|nr:Histone-lysine N-methyltransferase ATXR2 [Sesamum angolense]
MPNFPTKSLRFSHLQLFLKSRQATVEYFEALVAERQCSGFKVKPDGQHGKGGVGLVLGRNPFNVGYNFQELDAYEGGMIDCLVCSFCFRFIGSIELQIGRKLYLQELGVSAVDECGSSDACGCLIQRISLCLQLFHVWEDAKKLIIAGVAILEVVARSNHSIQLVSVVMKLDDVIDRLFYKRTYLCHECIAYSVIASHNKIYFCSKSCAEADWGSFHSLLCIGHGSSSPNTEALLKFMKHANETNDIFILAAKVISFTILRYRKLKAAHVQREGKHDSSNQFDGCIFPLLLESWKPVSMGFKRRWWECIALPEDVDSSEEVEFRMQIKDLAFEGFARFGNGRKLNPCDLVVASPVEDYFLYIDDLPLSQKKEAEKLTKPFLDALGDDYSISCQDWRIDTVLMPREALGSSCVSLFRYCFFPFAELLNHSCIPNAKAFKREEDKDGQATIVALRPIFKGEEITISYIDEDLPYDERQDLLADYGFRCKCPRCVEEP